MYSALIVDDEAPARQLLKALGRWNDIHVTNIYEADSGRFDDRSNNETGYYSLRYADASTRWGILFKRIGENFKIT